MAVLEDGCVLVDGPPGESYDAQASALNRDFRLKPVTARPSWGKPATVRANIVSLIGLCIEFVTARRRIFCLLACIVLFLLSLSRYWERYGDSVPRTPESYSLAQNLYHTGKFANPFASLATGPSAHLSPVMPAFMALLMKVYGDQSKGIYSIELAAQLVLALQLALYPVFSRTLGMGEINGFIGASIWLLAKPQIVDNSEPLYVALLVAVACCCYRSYLDQRPQGRRKLAWLLGGLIGFSIFTSPTVAPIYAAWLAREICCQKSGFFKESLLPLVLLPIMIVAPWTVRNYLVFDRFPIIRDNFGLELSVSNNDCAQFGIRASEKAGCFAKVHPNVNVNEAEKVIALGEVKYNEVKLREALVWIGSHPIGFVNLSVMRFVAFWFPTETFSIHYACCQSRWERVLIYLMTLLSGFGLVTLYRRDYKSAAILISCLAAFPLVYYIVEFEYRYRYPILWMTFLLGAMPITTCAGRLWNTFCSEPR